jgi:hypothetical protein
MSGALPGPHPARGGCQAKDPEEEPPQGEQQRDSDDEDLGRQRAHLAGTLSSFAAEINFLTKERPRSPGPFNDTRKPLQIFSVTPMPANHQYPQPNALT